MRRRLATTCSLGALGALMISASTAQASGFLIYDLSAEALAKGSAVTASTREPAAVWFNPAGLSFVPGVRASTGGIMVVHKTQFSPANGDPAIDSKPGTFFIPAVFVSGQVSDRLHFGLGGYTAFGLGIEWPEEWLGREDAIKAELATFTINPTLSLRLRPNLSFAAGFQAVRGAVDFTNGLPSVIGGKAQIVGSGWGFGGNAGLMYRALPNKLHLGLTYRSRVRLELAGSADFDPSPEFAQDLRDQGGSAEIPLPDIVSTGVMYKPSSSLELTMDVNLGFWSTYDKLVLKFEDPDMQPKVMERNNHTAATLRLGADWATPVRGLHARAGFIADQNPSPKEYLSPSLPDAHRVDFSLGAGYTHKWFKADVGYLLVYFLPSESVGGNEGPEGTYQTVAHLISTTLTFRLD
ncbi:MAG: outer membrane protein transport protein [Deltaproteobacteria bacterium]|nr:outer membrane protein transport protein [Deltaproteobacteria bacterium]